MTGTLELVLAIVGAVCLAGSGALVVLILIGAVVQQRRQRTATAGELRVTLTADTAQFERELRRLLDDARRE